MTSEPVTTTVELAGKAYTLRAAPARRLSEVLREELGLKSVKVGCDAGDCGACTVLIDGAQHCACLTPLAQADGRRIETLETVEPELSARLQQAFLQHGAAQCGICTPGFMMAAIELLRADPTPDRPTVEAALGGVLCRCTGYRKIVSAVMAVGGEGADPVVPSPGQAVGRSIPRVDG
ncbi:MAG: (2Fe-2S)-binding protein, partial [Pseudomonadota bacterium]